MRGTVFAVALSFLAMGALTAEPRRYALVIGINEYEYLGKLQCCRQDAEELARVLVERAGFDPDYVCLMADVERPRPFQPTYANLLRRFKQFTSLPREGDTLLVFFAGHGLTVDKKAYLMPVNGSDEHTGIAISWLRQRIEACKASRKILILDACHSGQAARGTLGIVPSAARGAATLVMTSCDAREISYPEDGHGVFTAGLLKGLSGAADADEDGEITGAELYACIRDHVEEWSIRTGKTQTPQMFPEEAADLVVARIPPREALYRKAMAEGEGHLEAQRWQEAEAAFRRALAVEGYGADAKALEGLRRAQEGLEAQRKRLAYEAALARVREAYGRARGAEDQNLWQEVKRLAERAIATGHADVSAARVMLKEAERHLGPPVYTDWPFDAQEAARRQQETAAALNLPVEETLDLGGGVKMRLVLIPAGEFMMGSRLSAEEVHRRWPGGAPEWYEHEHPRHRVRITRPFYMGACEVTQEQWSAVMGSKPWSGRLCRGRSVDAPANYISWNDAQEFCRRLSAIAGRPVRLPTEAEWEYACRAGSTTAYCFGDDPRRLGEYAWYRGNAWDLDENYPHGVARKRPNAWGLYDMHGNVWEWCQDWYAWDYYARSPSADPKGPTNGKERVLRGGSWVDVPGYCRSALRLSIHPNYSDNDRGFRVVVSPGP